jgi:hypothetical protein
MLMILSCLLLGLVSLIQLLSFLHRIAISLIFMFWNGSPKIDINFTYYFNCLAS